MQHVCALVLGSSLVLACGGDDGDGGGDTGNPVDGTGEDGPGPTTAPPDDTSSDGGDTMSSTFDCQGYVTQLYACDYYMDPSMSLFDAQLEVCERNAAANRQDVLDAQAACAAGACADLVVCLSEALVLCTSDPAPAIAAYCREAIECGWTDGSAVECEAETQMLSGAALSCYAEASLAALTACEAESCDGYTACRAAVGPL